MFSQSQSISLETLNNRQLIPQYNLQSILDQINPQIKSLKLDSELSFILGFTIGKYNSNIEQVIYKYIYIEPGNTIRCKRAER